MSGGETPGGWYPDPNDPSQERFWDGVAWSDATRPAGGYAPPPPVPPPPPGAGPSGYPPPPPPGAGYPPPPVAPTAPFAPPGSYAPPPPPTGYSSPLPPPPGTYAPGPYGMPGYLPTGTPPQNYLVWSILVTLFCCLPFGIAAIVQSSKVDSLWRSGDVAGANKASQDAKKWVTVSLVLGLVVVVLYIAAVIAAGSTTTSDF